jgi:hypothetical protein
MTEVRLQITEERTQMTEPIDFGIRNWECEMKEREAGQLNQSLFVTRHSFSWG